MKFIAIFLLGAGSGALWWQGLASTGHAIERSRVLSPYSYLPKSDLVGLLVENYEAWRQLALTNIAEQPSTADQVERLKNLIHVAQEMRAREMREWDQVKR